jgi:hypothetical protein
VVRFALGAAFFRAVLLSFLRSALSVTFLVSATKKPLSINVFANSCARSMVTESKNEEKQTQPVPSGLSAEPSGRVTMHRGPMATYGWIRWQVQFKVQAWKEPVSGRSEQAVNKNRQIVTDPWNESVIER